MKGDTMRPLIEILEDERTLCQRLDAVYRYLLKDDDPEVLEILYAQKEKVERQLDANRNELRDYIDDLLSKR